ncbi:ABC transporter ATP-binding protein [Halovivax limisalsi]|uniref:ABC transporter ATP-binding protein n=1 Tax=Halovivax limisalsi TaxID=1453760 RepID=UPI001FFD3A55|nr:ABC transporter ATP-binding protein [Halovivax limisalsi]
MSDTKDLDVELSWREKGRALYRVALFQPWFAAGVIALSLVAALLEGIGLTFIQPIIEVAQGSADAAESSALVGLFLAAYDRLGLPFTLGSLVAGVAVVMTIRYTTSFLVGWFRAAIETRYVRHLQEEAFTTALDAEVAYFDQEGSDDILNAIVTQAEYAGRVIRYAINTIEQGLLALMYFAVAVVIAPALAVVTAAFLGTATVLFRNVLQGGYSLGDEVADAKEGIQSNAQAGTQGIRDVKVFGMVEELKRGFVSAADSFERARIALLRNDAAIQNFYQLTVAVSVFGLIYVALTFLSLSVGELGVFLFAMFQLGPKVSSLNRYLYRVEGELPHLVRTQAFVEELQRHREPTSGATAGADADATADPDSGATATSNSSATGTPDGGATATPVSIDEFAFDDVHFSYETSDESVLQGVSFAFERGDFVAFVGPSGAGKSTIASLFARLYEPDSGQIRADGTPIDAFDVSEWRDRVSIVRQDPHVFNESLRRNITIGKRDASQAEIERVARIARVTEFLDELPEGYDTVLGDQGVKLSGGQRQRVALARALLKDADLLILDEATSDLDTGLEREVHEGIEAMERDYAMLVIAHRLSTVTNADRIYTMEDGRIVEDGPHRELVDADGTYSTLYAMQSA